MNAAPFTAGKFTMHILSANDARAIGIPVHAAAVLIALLTGDHGEHPVAMGFASAAELSDFCMQMKPRTVTSSADDLLRATAAPKEPPRIH